MTELPATDQARVNVQDIRAFLEFLDTEKIFTFSILDADSESVVPGYGVRHGTWEEAIAVCEGLPGSTLHVTLNRTNMRGRKTTDMVSCRVLCLDLDTTHAAYEIRSLVEVFRAGMVIESSPGKFHLYWKVDMGMSLPDWSFFQLGVAALLGGDKQLCQVAKTIRVPGVERVTKKGERFVPWIRYIEEDSPVRGRGDVLALFPGIEEAALLAEEEMKKERARVRREWEKARVNPSKKVSVGELGRNLTVYEIVREEVGIFVPGKERLTLDEAIEVGLTVNKGFDSPLEEREVRKASESAWRRGSGVWEGRAAKYQEARERSLELLETVAPSEGTEVTEELVQAAERGPQNGYSGFAYDYDHGPISDSRFSDMALLQRAVQRFWNELARVAGHMYAFNLSTRVWAHQGSGEHTEIFSFLEACARDVVRDPEFLRAKCMTPQGDLSLKKQAAEVERVLGLRGYRNLVSGMLNHHQVKVYDEDIFDSREELLFTASGVLDMRTGKLREAEARDFLLNRTAVAWDGGAECPGWERFLSEVYSGNEDPAGMISFLQELFGYSLSGGIGEQRIFCHCGDGSNGKSLILWALGAVSGGYSTFVDPDELATKKGKFGKNFERFGWKIEGKRIGIVDDIEVGTVWSEGFVKGVTSHKIRCRGEHEKSRVRENHAKVHLGLNVMPKPEAENYGLLRRLCLIPYRVRFVADAEKGSELEALITSELPGILRWAVVGYQRRRERGKLEYPAETLAEVEMYRKTNFTMESICEEMFSVPRNDTEGTWEFVSDLVDDFNAELRVRGRVEEEVTPESLVRALKRMPGKWETKKVRDPRRNNAFAAYRIILKYSRDRMPSPLL